MDPFYLLRKLWMSKLIRDNFVLFVGNFFAGVLGFLYHFYVARILGPEDYGVLGTILSAFYMINVAFTNTIQATVSRFAVGFWVKDHSSLLAYLLRRATYKLALYALLLYIAYLFFVPFLSRFLLIDAALLRFSGLLIFFAFLIPIGRGILQGCQRFIALSLNLFIEGAVKFGAGVLFVYLGYRVFGAVGAIVLAELIVLLFFLAPLRSLLTQQREKFDTREVYSYSFPVFIILLSLTAFFSIDVLIVKHFFEPALAGYYAALSLLGKIIFFGSISITQVMFAKASESHEKKTSWMPAFLRSLGILVCCLIVGLAVYFAFSPLLVSLLFGSSFLSIVPYVGWFGVFIALYSLVYFISFYYLALKKKFFVFFLLLANVLQIALLWRYHSSFAAVITISSVLMAVLFVALCIPLLAHIKKPSLSAALLKKSY